MLPVERCTNPNAPASYAIFDASHAMSTSHSLFVDPDEHALFAALFAPLASLDMQIVLTLSQNEHAAKSPDDPSGSHWIESSMTVAIASIASFFVSWFDRTSETFFQSAEKMRYGALVCRCVICISDPSIGCPQGQDMIAFHYVETIDGDAFVHAVSY